MWRKTFGVFGLGVSVCLLGVSACSSDGSTEEKVPEDDGASSQPSQNPPDLPDESPSGGAPGSGGAAADAGPAAPPTEVMPASYMTCDPAERTGQFRIEMTPEVPDVAAFSSILGKVEDGIVPVNVLVTEMSSGDCHLVKAPTYSCDPLCGGLETCGPEGCLAYPESQDVGIVSITGLNVPMEIEPRASTKSYSNPVAAMLPHPAMPEGADVVLSAAGGEHTAFSLRGIGIAPLKISPDAIPINSGEPAIVKWEAASTDSASRVVLNLNIDNHGSTAASIRCETADDGEAEIPTDLIDELLAVGFSGYPTLAVRRQFSSAVQMGLGCVEMLIASEYVASVELEGVVSCGENEDCPEGQTCQQLLICE